MAVPSLTSPSALPSQFHITLLLKHHKSTTLLSVSPSQPFPEIKALLLAALKTRGITSLFHLSGSSTTLPSDPSALDFGVLADKKDTSRGWVLLRASEVNGDVKGKKKASIGKSKSTAGEGNTPEEAGLGDGSLVAYRIRKAGKDKGLERGEDDETDEIDVDTDMEDDPGWDVVLPTFEDEDREPEGLLNGVEESEQNAMEAKQMLDWKRLRQGD